jgi:hypothetical protein
VAGEIVTGTDAPFFRFTDVTVVEKVPSFPFQLRL